MTKILYISASSYSGTTLLSFLLNTHPKITTIAHTKGWKFDEQDNFYCSCGELIQKCAFYRTIQKKFEENHLKFAFNDFGTNYELSTNERVNRYLTAKLPLINDTTVERFRDRVVSTIPNYYHKLQLQDRSNKVLIQTALEYSQAEIFVDNSHDPFRIRHLRRIKDFSIFNLHLIRDPRGFALSNKKHKGWDVKLSTRLWLRRQADILRLSEEFENSYRLYYEDLCENVNEKLAEIYQFVGVEGHHFDGDFKTKEHHIIGNEMRLKGGDVKVDKKWMTQLSDEEIKTVNNELKSRIRDSRNKTINDIVEHYLQ